MGTPTAKVEEFLGKYQKMDSEVLTQLDSVISTDEKMSDSQKDEYRGLMERQYQNLSYKIKNEEIDGDKATVDVEIEVYDYATSITKSKKYYNDHRDEFMDDTDNDTDKNNSSEEVDEGDEVIGGVAEDAADAIGDAVEDMLDETKKFVDYKLTQLKDVTDKAKYDITFYLSKDEDGEWELENISDVDRQKLHGLYEG
jgi:hypothetical protein